MVGVVFSQFSQEKQKVLCLRTNIVQLIDIKKNKFCKQITVDESSPNEFRSPYHCGLYLTLIKLVVIQITGITNYPINLYKTSHPRASIRYKKSHPGAQDVCVRITKKRQSS